MVCDTESKTMTVEQTVELRRQATDLLNRLIADREQSERRLAEAGKRDPMKFVTGRTAFDSAITSAKELIASMDNLLGRLNGELDGPPVNGAPYVHTMHFPSRNGKTAGTNGVRAPVSATMTP
jgi:hypothetical protein